MVMPFASRALWALALLALAACNLIRPLRPTPEPRNEPTLGSSDGGTPTDDGEPDGLPPSLALPSSSEDGARKMLKQFVEPNADLATLTSALRPTTADYEAMFDPQLAAKIEKAQAKGWSSGKAVIQPKPGQTEIKLWSATGTELAGGSGSAKEFPPEYQKLGVHLGPSVLFYRFKFVEPGKEIGTAYDGLAFVNGHWVIVPKPWRALEGRGLSFEDEEKPAAPPKKKPRGKRR
ncbi:MAG TPA: hypothetical protein VM925_11345 [Labilithrix sp.]|nr:hypothetical protein [Labilithrix sp.]